MFTDGVFSLKKGEGEREIFISELEEIWQHPLQEI